MKKKTAFVMSGIDLHCHLDGSMTRQSICEILGRDVAESELQVGENCTGLTEYLKKFDIPLQCLQTYEGLKKSAKDFLLSLTKDQIKYVEVRFAPQLSAHEGLGCAQVMEAVLEGLEEAKKECGIFYQVIACAMRHHEEETNLQMLKACREFLGNGLAAADLAGDESSFPTRRFGSVFEYAKKLDYPFTIHAGECGSVQSILDAVDMGAKRIGHGIAMAGALEVQRLLAGKRIGVELCPISNYQTKAVRPGGDYPFREFLKNGVPVTVNTDNRTVSHTTLLQEMNFLQEHCGITEEELQKARQNAIETAFCDDDTKHILIKT